MDTADEIPVVEFNPQTDAYQFYHDWGSNQSLTTTVITAIAEITNASPTEIDPLYESVDPDALNTIYEPIRGGELRQEGGHVRFILNDCEITVYWNGRTTIKPQAEF